MTADSKCMNSTCSRVLSRLVTRASMSRTNKIILSFFRNYKESPDSKRNARFRCVAAFVGGNVEKITVGICHGRIASAPQGTNGFGYDPLFFPDGYQETFAHFRQKLEYHESPGKSFFPHERVPFFSLQIISLRRFAIFHSLPLKL